MDAFSIIISLAGVVISWIALSTAKKKEGREETNLYRKDLDTKVAKIEEDISILKIRAAVSENISENIETLLGKVEKKVEEIKDKL